jgi:hypothetical protein
MQQLKPGLPEHLRPRRNEYRHIGSVFAVALVSFSVPAPLRFEDALVLEVEQRIDPVRAFQVNVSAIPAVSAAGTAFGHKLLSPEGETSIPAIPSLNLYLCTINKQSGSAPQSLRSPFQKKRTPTGVPKAMELTVD